jgi:hypothetical protein
MKKLITKKLNLNLKILLMMMLMNQKMRENLVIIEVVVSVRFYISRPIFFLNNEILDTESELEGDDIELIKQNLDIDDNDLEKVGIIKVRFNLYF